MRVRDFISCSRSSSIQMKCFTASGYGLHAIWGWSTVWMCILRTFVWPISTECCENIVLYSIHKEEVFAGRLTNNGISKGLFYVFLYQLEMLKTFIPLRFCGKCFMAVLIYTKVMSCFKNTNNRIDLYVQQCPECWWKKTDIICLCKISMIQTYYL